MQRAAYAERYFCIESVKRRDRMRNGIWHRIREARMDRMQNGILA